MKHSQKEFARQVLHKVFSYFSPEIEAEILKKFRFWEDSPQNFNMMWWVQQQNYRSGADVFQKSRIFTVQINSKKFTKEWVNSLSGQEEWIRKKSMNETKIHHFRVFTAIALRIFRILKNFIEGN